MQIFKQFTFDQKRKIYIYISLHLTLLFLTLLHINIALKDMFCTKFPPGILSAEKYYVEIIQNCV